MLWLKDGDTNSKLFQAVASARNKRNKIVTLLRDDGIVAEGQEALSDTAKLYFEDLF